ncbi:MAG TPA: hypothetical protein EYG11_15140, partial [Candidatus Latescibacteria bacterium]|nr:hypothetical protein [Candidatus Latescibacterota bacterium]
MLSIARDAFMTNMADRAHRRLSRWFSRKVLWVGIIVLWAGSVAGPPCLAFFRSLLSRQTFTNIYSKLLSGVVCLWGRSAALVLVCLLLVGRSVEAQPTVSSTSPVAAFASAPSTSNLTATFSAAVTAGGAASFVVHSALSGQQAGAYSGNNSTTLTFNPAVDFFPGETVFSTLTTAVQTTGGILMASGYVWQFTTEVSA